MSLNDSVWYRGLVADPILVGEPDYQGDPLPARGRLVYILPKTWHAWVLDADESAKTPFPRLYLYKPDDHVHELWATKAFYNIEPVRFPEHRRLEDLLHLTMQRSYEQCPNCLAKHRKFKHPLDIQMGLCSSCRRHFQEALQLCSEKELVIAGSDIFEKGEDPTGPITYPNLLGYGGRFIKFRFWNGREVWGRNWWRVGSVPPQLSDFLPDNAEMLEFR